MRGFVSIGSRYWRRRRVQKTGAGRAGTALLRGRGPLASRGRRRSCFSDVESRPHSHVVVLGAGLLVQPPVGAAQPAFVELGVVDPDREAGRCGVDVARRDAAALTKSMASAVFSQEP
jgi:hypothetical protein